MSANMVLSNDFIFSHEVFSKFEDAISDLDPLPDDMESELDSDRLIRNYSEEFARLEEASIDSRSLSHALSNACSQWTGTNTDLFSELSPRLAE